MARIAVVEGAARRVEQQRVAGGGGDNAAVFLIQPDAGGCRGSDLTEGTGVAGGGTAVGLLPPAGPFVLHQGRLLPVFDSAYIVDAVIEGSPPHCRPSGFLHAFFISYLIVGAGPEALEGFVWNDIHNASDRIGTVQRRTAVKHHLQPVDSDLGKRRGYCG